MQHFLLVTILLRNKFATLQVVLTVMYITIIFIDDVRWKYGSAACLGTRKWTIHASAPLLFLVRGSPGSTGHGTLPRAAASRLL